jgi:uncharacterized membrane protein
VKRGRRKTWFSPQDSPLPTILVQQSCFQVPLSTILTGEVILVEEFSVNVHNRALIKKNYEKKRKEKKRKTSCYCKKSLLFIVYLFVPSLFFLNIQYRKKRKGRKRNETKTK